MSRTYLSALVLTATMVAATSGCGGSSKTSNHAQIPSTAATAPPASSAPASTQVAPAVTPVKVAAGTPLTRAAWIAKGDAICARLNAQLETTTITSQRPAEYARVLPQAAAYERAELTQLVKLTPPRSMAGDWQKFLTDTKIVAENSVRLAMMAQTGRFNVRAPLAIATRNAHEQLAHIARRDGFKRCSFV